MIKTGVGLNRNLDDSFIAGAGAAKEASRAIDGMKASLVLVFASHVYAQDKLIEGVASVFGDALIVGGTGGGVITSIATAYDGVGVMALVTDSMKFFTGHAGGVAEYGFKAGIEAAHELVLARQGEDIKVCLVICDGGPGKTSEVLRGIQSVLGNDILLVGCGTGGAMLQPHTSQYYQSKALTDSVVLVGVSGKVKYKALTNHAWEPIGLPFKVTKSEGLMVHEINNEPAMQVYEDYFGKDAGSIIKEPMNRIAYTYPFGLEIDNSGDYLIRPVKSGRENGSIETVESLPQGTVARLMISDREAALKATKKCVESLEQYLRQNQAAFLLVFNSVARNMLLGAKTAEESQIISDAIGPSVPIFGLFAFGEIGPTNSNYENRSYVHNETMVLFAMGE